jgi:hypothetical protein
MRLLNEAGFVRVQASFSAESYEPSVITAVMVEHHRAPSFVKVVLENGWADQTTVDARYREMLVRSRRRCLYLTQPL